MQIVLDWDGTCTEVDGLHMLLEEFGDREVYEHMEGVLGNGLTLHQVIATEIGTITLPLDFAVDWMREHVDTAPRLRGVRRVRLSDHSLERVPRVDRARACS